MPLKMQSDIRSARRVLWLCSPRTQEIASTMLDLPHPFGPMMQLSPAPLNVRCVFSQKDLNPTNSTLRSLSKRPLMFRHASPKRKHFGRYGFGFLEKRRYATTTLAGRVAVAQPSGAWIGGYRPHDSTWSYNCKALATAAFRKRSSLRNSASERYSRQFNGPGCVAGVVALG